MGAGRGRGGRGGRRGGGRDDIRRHKASRGDVRAAVVALIAEQPMHGYQIMQEMKERSRGAWQPSPGSIYPTLQQLADEGLVTSSDDGGRKVFTLTEAGQAVVEDSTEPPPWEDLAASDDFVDMRRTAASVMAATKQVAHVGSSDQVTAATEILTDARKRLYQVLAE